MNGAFQFLWSPSGLAVFTAWECSAPQSFFLLQSSKFHVERELPSPQVSLVLGFDSIFRDPFMHLRKHSAPVVPKDVFASPDLQVVHSPSRHLSLQ